MYNTKGKTQKVYNKNKPKLNLIPKNCVFVFPIELVGGKTLVSNLGIMPNRKYYDKGSFLYWQEVLDGRSALKLQWEDSITLEKPEGKNYYLVKASVGKYYYGKPISSGTEGMEIAENQSFDDFLSIKANQTITLRFEYDPNDRIGSKYELQEQFKFKLVDNDIYNLYQIPEICENKLMYIESHNEYFEDDNALSAGCEITFASLGDKIQKSGKAIEQYCSWNAPGEFAVVPKVIEYYTSETEWEKQVVIDPIFYYYPTPIKYLQVEQQGPALTSTIYALGRRQEWDEEEQCWKIGPSKILLPCDFITTQPNPLNRTSTPTKNFYCFPDEQVSMITNTEALKWMIEQATSPLETPKNNGMITIGSNWAESGSHIRTEHPSNPVNQTTGIRKDYFDKNWYPLSYTDAPLGPHDTSGCVYAEDTMSFTDTDTMVDIMCKNAFIYNSQPIIPLSYYDSRPLYLRNIPLIGAIANFFKLGDLKLSSRTTSRKNSNLCYFGDCSIMNMCANLNGSTEQGSGTFGTPFKTGACIFPINFFGTNESKFLKLGVGATNTTFCVQLTDQVSINGNAWDTIYLGQSKYEDGTELFPETHQSLLVNSTLKPIVPSTSNFIIDAVVVQSIFDGKIRLSCYGPEEQEFIYPQWTATILSNANWEDGNLRDWTNIFLLSNWEERFCVQQDQFTWPEEPTKKDFNNYTWNLNANDTFTFVENFDLQPNYNTWQQVSGFDWPLLSKIGSSLQSTLNKNFYTNTISYSDLGVESVVDKDSFINYYKNMVFAPNGTLLSLDNKSITIQGLEPIQLELQTGVYTYTWQNNLATIRRASIWELPTNNNDFIINDKPSAVSGPASFVQTLGAEIILEDTLIRINLYDKSQVMTSYNLGENKEFFTYRQVAGTLYSQKITSSIKLDKITFVKK